MINQTSSLEFSHFPVMLNEVLKFSKTKVQEFDRDKKASLIATKIEKKFPKRFKFYRSKFSKLENKITGNVDTIIFDLGLSSIQLDDLERGFSFKSSKKLNMSMGLNDFSALEVVNNLSETHLKSIIKVLGDEKEANKIAKNIVKQRKVKQITNTADLVKIIHESKKKNYFDKINPCTKTFQAIRIFVNREITELILGIISATKKLKPGGKILVISFHSIEDRIIKYFFSNYSKNKSRSSRYLPENEDDNFFLFSEYKNKVLRPSEKEIELNSRSRSAKLRFAIRSEQKFRYPKNLIKKFKKYLELESINV